MKIGLTGGIGAGKTTIAKVFESLGIPIFYADQHAKEIMDSSPILQKNIINSFGDSILTNNKIDKKKLAKKVFANKVLLQKLNNLVHPLLFEKFTTWILDNPSTYCIMEVAILYESGADSFLDKVIYVDAPEKLRLKRVMQRDSVDRESVINRMKNQLPSNILREKADFVIENSGITPVLPSILKIHQEILRQCL